MAKKKVVTGNPLYDAAVIGASKIIAQTLDPKFRTARDRGTLNNLNQEALEELSKVCVMIVDDSELIEQLQKKIAIRIKQGEKSRKKKS